MLRRLRLCGIAVISVLALAPASYAADTDPDNAKQNAGEVKSPTGTADDQPNGKSDVEMTRKIRQAIIADKSLSTYAHNVKIITTEQSVTLKGPVRTAKEKRQVEAIAKKNAGSLAFASEITIAPK